MTSDPPEIPNPTEVPYHQRSTRVCKIHGVTSDPISEEAQNSIPWQGCIILHQSLPQTYPPTRTNPPKSTSCQGRKAPGETIRRCIYILLRDEGRAMELCDRIPMIPREADIVRNELQNPTLVNTRTERPIPKLMILLYFLCLQKGALYLLLVD